MYFVSQILSESDHRNATQAHMAQVSSTNANEKSSDANETNDTSKNQSSQNITSVPIGENESFLLDMVYKCLRGKGVRMINSNYSNSNSNNLNRSSANESSRNREKENSIENHWSDDEIPIVPVNATNNNQKLPPAQRFSSSKYAYVPRAIALNHFNMGRGRGTCHVKHSVDATRRAQQQLYQRMQSQQHNGTYANNMIIRNNGVMRLNANLTINALTNNVYNSNTVKTTVTNISTANTNTNNVNNSTTNSIGNVSVGVSQNANSNVANPKLAAFKKPVQYAHINSIATTTNGSIMLVNTSGTGTVSPAGGNQRVTILRRPQQSIHVISRPPIDPTNSYALMPTIHRVRTRMLKPNLPKILETDRLLESLKSIIRPQKINRNYDTTKKVLSVYQSLVKAANHANHHINTNSSSSSSKRKSHSSLSNHKSSSSMTTSSTQKSNGQNHANGGIVTSGTNYMSSHQSTNNLNNHIEKRTHIRIDVNHK